MIRRVSLATDFSAEGRKAFLTALALALFYSARLEILHVSSPARETAWEHFPKVRDTLEAWGLLPPGSQQEDVHDRLGVEIGKVEIHSEDAVSGIAGYVLKHTPDLLVAASHGRTGINWWLSGSVSIETFRMTRTPTLLLGPSAQPFIDEESGRLNLHSILFPVAASPSPVEATRQFKTLMGNIPARVIHVHVSEKDGADGQLDRIFPELTTLDGDVVPSILRAARDTKAGMIVMPTAGRHGFIDAFRGSVTQRILHDAPCPILALPSR
jgi:nucleotide-binding universal stress UspA family protein